MLEWQVEIYPRKNLSNRHSDRRAYDSDFIKENYTLPETEVHLALQGGDSVAISQTSDTGIYSGRCVLANYAPLTG